MTNTLTPADRRMLLSEGYVQLTLHDIMHIRSLVTAEPSKNVEQRMRTHAHTEFLFMELFYTGHPFLTDPEKLTSWKPFVGDQMALRSALVYDAPRLSALLCIREDSWLSPIDAPAYAKTPGKALEFLYRVQHLLTTEARGVVQRNLQKMPLPWFQAKRDRIDMVRTLTPDLVPSALHRVCYATPIIHTDLERLYPGLTNMVKLWTQLAPADTQGKRKFYHGQMALYLKSHKQKDMHLSSDTDLFHPEGAP